MQKNVKKKDRMAALSEIVRTKNIGNQEELCRELGNLGIGATQSSVSRDLIELGVTKLRGVYFLSVPVDETKVGAVLEMDSAGDHMIVVKTPPGQASMVALEVDRARIPEVVGTVAGDDTFFVAVRTRKDQKSAMSRIRDITG
jgi:transcriptional regulator of arginine metabolism